MSAGGKNMKGKGKSAMIFGRIVFPCLTVLLNEEKYDFRVRHSGYVTV